jgi:hypothetical protein
MRTFEDFCERFIQLIGSPSFGEKPKWKPRAHTQGMSPAFRELRKTGVSAKLQSKPFLRRVYSHAVEHDRREAQRLKIPILEKEVRPTIQRSRGVQGKLEAAAKTLKNTFLPKYRDALGEKLEQKLWQLIEEIEDEQFAWNRSEKSEVSRLHPASRKKSDEPSGWRPVFESLKDLHYDLEKISFRAVDQWFHRQIDQLLNSLPPGAGLTQMTRMKLIAASRDAAGLGFVEPATIKEFFESSKRKRKVG